MMIRSWKLGLIAATALVTASASGSAASLQVMPINIEVLAPGAASTVTLSNQGGDIVNAQIRVFKWVQQDGQDQLVPTKDVVASPPAIKLTQAAKGVVRVVRLGKTPAAGEESYRLVVDEVPPPPKPGQVGVGFTVRYSIPVFFSAAGADSKLAWKATFTKGQLRLVADNSGSRHVRVASLQIVDGKGAAKTVVPGLAGYVLGNSWKLWQLKVKSVAAGGTIKIKAESDNGPIEASVQVQAAN